MKPFFITTPIYYVNDKPHIGHAYTSLACDVLARFKRLDGYKVHFLTGTDEHGQKIEKAAVTAGMTPKDFTDSVSVSFRELAKVMGYSNDDFIRTTEKRHIESSQGFWKKLMDNGQIYLGSYAGWYAVRDEAFYAESELVEGKAPTGAPVEWVEEPSYFFKLSEWQEPLLKFYQENPDFIQPESRRNEVIRFVEGGLLDLSISRTSFKWGIPVPGDEKHVMYVWLDALVNYISALGFPDESAPMYQEFWPADIHMVGKDIVRFHAIYWPAFLMAAKMRPPKKVFAHGWWTNEGQKISKSLGNVIDPIELVSEFGLDAVRYYLLREVPFGNDGNFSRTLFIQRVNAELANNIGNLAQRTLSIIQKHCEGKVPDPGSLQEVDQALLAFAGDRMAAIRLCIEKTQFHLAMQEIVDLAVKANAYIDEQAPWTLAKTDKTRLCAVLYTLAETIRHLALYLQPFIPDSAGKMLDQLAIPESARDYTFVSQALAPGHPLPAPQGVFPRIAA